MVTAIYTIFALCALALWKTLLEDTTSKNALLCSAVIAFCHLSAPFALANTLIVQLLVVTGYTRRLLNPS